MKRSEPGLGVKRGSREETREGGERKREGGERVLFALFLI